MATIVVGGHHAANRLAHGDLTVGICRGLLHAEDGAVGARARSALAAEFLPEFGISTECGLGRHSTDQLEAVLVAWQEYASTREPALAAS